ncbi:MAG: efflux RND transporter periplasmic adaptor subunit [Bdellovibrionales bacterium]
MIKRFILMFLVVGLVLGGVFGFKFFVAVKTKEFMAKMPEPAQTVSSVKVGMESWQPNIEAVGSLRAVQGADLSSEVAGIVKAVSFESGGDVEKGAALIQLRAEEDIARLEALTAAEKLAVITLQRDQKQLRNQAVSQATIDNDQANLDGSRAALAAQKAVVEKKTIRAPFSGHLGIRAVDVGQYVTPGMTLVTLQQLDPIYVDFNLPERSLTQIAKGQKVAAKVEAYPDVVFEGEISAINVKVDEATRNIQARAVFKNAAQLLLPGMFAAVTIETGTAERRLTLPQTAVTYNPYGNTVYVIERGEGETLTARQTFVTLGSVRGDQVAILKGLKEGDEVVTSGQLKLRNGAPVVVNNEIQPSNEAQPKVKDK